MIKIVNVSKKFEEKTALEEVSLNIEKGCLYGLVGSNGAGKSTLLRLVSGVYQCDTGSVTLGGAPIYENPAAKKRLFFVPDELYFLPQSNLRRMALFYASCYPQFNWDRFYFLAKTFDLNSKAGINSFSKGMKRQAAAILALCCETEYLLFDETFDGLDPIMRNLVRKLLYSDICERNLTVILSSHSLRELEDTCDHIALLHKGGLLLNSDVTDLKTSLFKIQVAFEFPYDQSLFKEFDVCSFIKSGSVARLIVQGDREELSNKIKVMSPVLYEAVPLTLEEVFLYQMEQKGYSFPDILPEKEGAVQ